MAPEPRLDHLLSPGRIGSLEIRNRILMTPMGSNLAQADGHAGERIQRYYEERARGGAGLLIVGVGAICWPQGACNPNQLAISDDRFVPGLQNLVQRVHAHGARIAIQLQHASKVAVRDIAEGRPMWVPSPSIPKAGDLMNDLTPEEMTCFVASYTQAGARVEYHEMTTSDIALITRRFAEAADRAKRAGFDAVELHAGHGYLLSSFLSPAANHRDDEYGGSLENRARFLVEVIRMTKKRLGADFPVWCRIDAKEFRTPGGITYADAQRTAEIAEAAGADAIHVSAYADPTIGAAFTEAPLVHKPCGYVEFAAGIKQRVGIPVIAVGRIEPEQADVLVARGQADFVAMGRKLLADPELPRKLSESRPEDIRPCIYCYTCVGQIFLNACLRCAVNPATGRETEFEIRSTARPRHILVIGGGPAGLELARVARLRGHRVTLHEKSKRLGGTLFFSALVCPENEKLLDWLETQVRKLGIEICLENETTVEQLRALRPEVTVVAQGARRELPTIPGIDGPHVLSGDDLRALMTGTDRSATRKLSRVERTVVAAGNLLGVTQRLERARELTRRWMPIGNRVAILGGGLVGIELAEFLLERGRTVTVLEEKPYFASAMAPPRRWRVLSNLREHGARLIAGSTLEAIDENAVHFHTDESGKQTLPVDSVLVALGTQANPELAEQIAKYCPEVHSIGDCKGVGYIEGAILDAARLARTL